MMELRSSRGHPLVWLPNQDHIADPVITVELWPKWYGLQLVRPTGTIEEVRYPMPEDIRGWMSSGYPSSTWIDHVPNPYAVRMWAEQQGCDVDILAFEMMVGRWTIEREG